MTSEERIKFLEEQLSQALEQVRVTQEHLHVAQVRIEELEQQKTPPSGFVKAKVKKPQAEQKKPRKKRDAKHNHARQRNEAKAVSFGRQSCGGVQTQAPAERRRVTDSQ